MGVCAWKPTWQGSKSSCGFDPIGTANSLSKSRTRWPTPIGSRPIEWSIGWLLSMGSIHRVGCCGSRSGCVHRNCSARSTIADICCRLIAIAIGLVFFLAKAIGGCSGLRLPKSVLQKPNASIRTGRPQGSVLALKNQTSWERIPGLISPLGTTQPSAQATHGTVTWEIGNESVLCVQRLRVISNP